ncbi:hypothetical protein [Gottfriedia acidiceleris]|uniref:hypothetical protein n=1 Tax=Gottfriedia acidiceleris TaxID=371036 RepID=UPI000B44F42E|nr:hypothetical protein [Gottfriedia acidiceleris]
MNLRSISIIVALSFLILTAIDFSMDYAHYKDAISSTNMTVNETHIFKTHMNSSVNSHIRIGVSIIGYESLLLMAFAIKRKQSIPSFSKKN